MTINRQGTVRFGDAALYISESPEESVFGEWGKQFKRQVFKRIVQQLNRMGWELEVPAGMIERYGRSFAEDHRIGRKGDLQGELEMTGRCIEFKMWQDVANITREDGDGRYEFDKEEKMPYLLRLEMERTRRKIRDYLCNVFAGYEFEIVKGKSVMRGPGHLTALEWIEQDYRNCYHYNQELGRRGGDEYAFNSKSADGGKVTHGAKVYTTDYNGRIIVGTAYYNINNMWWVVSGKYGLRNKASFEIYTSHPGDLKRKRNDRTRLNRLESEMKKAVAVMDFKRADALKPLLLDARQKGETTA